MFEALTQKLESTFKKLSGRGKLNQQDIDEALKEIRVALLEADVHFQVTKDFCNNIRKKASGKEIEKSLTPGQTIVKFVHQELLHAMGDFEPIHLNFAPPIIIMLVGLQGSGKTTSCGKLARHLREEMRRRPLLVSVDVYRPAAMEQLKTLGGQLGIEVYPSEASETPVAIATKARDYAERAGFDTVILDTAGRLQIDDQLMDELADIVEAIEPQEILLVVDAMTGQVAVDVAKGFDERLELDGLVLTKLDGDARGGAALSMRAITNKPIKFIGIGEKLDALEPFRPDRMASRILGMGDVLGLIEKAAKEVTLQDSKNLQKKLRKNEFTLEDFYSQLQTVKKMGSIGSLMEMVPGFSKVAKGFDESAAEKEFKRVEAIILSMTQSERKDHEILDGSRRKRIALGSGTSVEEVNRLMKQFIDMRKVMGKLSKLGPKGLSRMGGLGNLSNMVNFRAPR